MPEQNHIESLIQGLRDFQKDAKVEEVLEAAPADAWQEIAPVDLLVFQLAPAPDGSEEVAQAIVIVWHENDEGRVISANYFELFLPGLSLLSNSLLKIEAD